MKLYLLPSVIGLTSMGWMVLVVWQWWISYHDLSNFIFGILIGFGGLYMAYDYNWKRNKDKEDRDQTKRLDAIVNWWMGLEKDSVKEIARGQE